MSVRCIPFCLGLLVLTCTLLLTSIPSAWANPVYECDKCHHPYMNIGAFREAMCLTCHGPGGFSSLRAASHASLDCIDCHETHGGSLNWLRGRNLKQLRANVDKTGQHSNAYPPGPDSYYPAIETLPENRVPVVFESRGPAFGEPSLHSFADGDEDGDGIFDGICEVCHLDYLNTTQHHRGETCTTCHLHSRGFRIVK